METSRKAVLQTGHVEFERCGRLPDGESLIKEDAIEWRYGLVALDPLPCTAAGS